MHARFEVDRLQRRRGWTVGRRRRRREDGRSAGDGDGRGGSGLIVHRRRRQLGRLAGDGLHLGVLVEEVVHVVLDIERALAEEVHHGLTARHENGTR
jgi:hypothetical protein